MSSSPMLSMSEVQALLTRQATQAAEQASQLLGSLEPSHKFDLHEGQTSDIKAIYERRSKRKSAAKGVEEFVVRLNRYSDATLLSTAAEVRDCVIYLFVSADATQLLGCVVARDHRVSKD